MECIKNVEAARITHGLMTLEATPLPQRCKTDKDRRVVQRLRGIACPLHTREVL